MTYGRILHLETSDVDIEEKSKETLGDICPTERVFHFHGFWHFSDSCELRVRKHHTALGSFRMDISGRVPRHYFMTIRLKGATITL